MVNNTKVALHTQRDGISSGGTSYRSGLQARLAPRLPVAGAAVGVPPAVLPGRLPGKQTLRIWLCMVRLPTSEHFSCTYS